MKKILASLCAAMLGGWLGGCQSKPALTEFAPTPAAKVIPHPLPPELLNPPTEAFTLGPGDQVEIEMAGNPLSHAYVTVGLDGKIYYSLLPGIDVWGLTLAQAKSRLDEGLSQYFSQPQVGITLKAVGSKYVWLLGRLNRPGIYPMTGSMTLLEGLTTAGGSARATSPTGTTQELGDLRHSFVMRQGKLLPVDFVRLLEHGDMSQNIYLLPDDFVYIPSSLSQEVYVLGAVVSPRSVPYPGQLSLVAALAGAGGVAPEAYETSVAIVRGSLVEPQIIEVNYKAMLKGKQPNVALEPGDIVYVPLSPYRKIDEYTDLILGTFTRAWSANVGSRTVLGNAANVGLNVSVGK